MTDFDPVEWITTQAAAELTGYDPSRFRQLAKRGGILARKWGRDWFLSKAAVLAYHQEMQRLGAEKHNPWREDLEEQGRGRRQDKADGADHSAPFLLVVRWVHAIWMFAEAVQKVVAHMPSL